jgi:hypothetical protein
MEIWQSNTVPGREYVRHTGTIKTLKINSPLNALIP